MKNQYLFCTAVVILVFAFIFMVFATDLKAQSGQGKILAKLDFDPEADGFGFENYGNEKRNWKKDLSYYDMILLFGAKAVCVTGNTQATCVPKRTAENWRIKALQEMDGGHCEGMAVTSLSFFEQREFKKKTAPADFQKDAESVNDLKFPSPSLENYIAYYFVTQLFDGVYDYRKVFEDKGPVNTVKELVASMNDQNATTYTLSIQQLVNGKFKGGHTITPIAVEDMGTEYRIHVYDNNFPNETRYLTVQKAGKQAWRYYGSTNPNEAKSLYVGDISTRSFFITPNDARYGKRFAAPFATNDEDDYENSSSNKVEAAEFLASGDVDMLVTAGDGKRVGYDWNKKQTVNEISGAKMIDVAAGYDDDLPPVIHLPYQSSGKPYTVTLSGNSLTEESRSDLVYSGPGFSVGFDNIKLDPNETLSFQISPDGKRISFTSSADGETPEIYFTANAPDGESYEAEIGGVELSGGKTLTGEFDLAAGKFYFKDNDGNEDKYDVDFERVLPNGTVQKYETNDIDMGNEDNFEMDFGTWDGKSAICFRDDQDGKGFANDECTQEPNEDNDMDSEVDDN